LGDVVGRKEGNILMPKARKRRGQARGYLRGDQNG